MLLEDKPEHFGLSIVEASCDNWEQQLLELLAPVALRSTAITSGGAKSSTSGIGNVASVSHVTEGDEHCSVTLPNRGGLERLDAELLDFTADGERGRMRELRERERGASSGDCLRALSTDGPWRLVFSEICEAYDIAGQLRARNDALAGQIAGLRWRRLGCDAAATALPPVPPPSLEASDRQGLPPVSAS